MRQHLPQLPAPPHDSRARHTPHAARQEPYTREELQWAGADHVADFVVAQGKLAPRLQLLEGPQGASERAAVAAALAAVPQLVVPKALKLAHT